MPCQIAETRLAVPLLLFALHRLGFTPSSAPLLECSRTWLVHSKWDILDLGYGKDCTVRYAYVPRTSHRASPPHGSLQSADAVGAPGRVDHPLLILALMTTQVLVPPPSSSWVSDFHAFDITSKYSTVSRPSNGPGCQIALHSIGEWCTNQDAFRVACFACSDDSRDCDIGCHGRASQASARVLVQCKQALTVEPDDCPSLLAGGEGPSC